MNRFGLVLIVPVLVALIALGGAQVADLQAPSGAAFEFGLIGDLPYTEEEKAKLPNLFADMNAASLAFVVHDGDFKSGDSLCDDPTFAATKAQLDGSAHPLIYVVGDNEWTDCHRESNGSYDPLERLAALRRLFFTDNNSLGQRKLALQRQSDDPAYASFPENVRWTFGEITLVGLHVVGSNNNLGRNAENDAEYAERNAATLEWMRQGFAHARATNSRGIMLIIQANPLFERPPEQRTGFNDFLALLEAETVAFGKPVVLVHGDTHYFRLDSPLVSSQTGRRIEHFTRVETYGTPDVHWVNVVVDYNHPSVFLFRKGIVQENLVPPRP